MLTRNEQILGLKIDEVIRHPKANKLSLALLESQQITDNYTINLPAKKSEMVIKSILCNFM